ncbi:sensor domain-containing protein [Rubrobacter aplysinae]|uniref:sensor domain-containing protein n=1 Tax=Rubrobacter aplysinae TaxID=909625 RepID=UPI00069F7C27|nr:EAL domain-containing protein [Rubrobacter aplysinae]
MDEGGVPAGTDIFSVHARYGSEVVTVLEPDGTIRGETSTIYRLLGYRPEDVEGTDYDPGQSKWFGFVHPEDSEKLLSAVGGCLATAGESPAVEYRIRHADDSWRWFESRGVNLASDPQVQGVVVSTRDVTDRKEAEQARIQSETRLKSAFEDAPMGVVVYDLESTLIAVNPALCKMLGYDRQELLGSSPLEITHPDDRPRSQQRTRKLLDGEFREKGLEKRYLRKGGGFVWAYCEARLVLDEGERPSHFVCHIQDITERKRTETELAESERRFRQLFEQSVDAVIVHDSEGNITDVNRQAVLSLGYSREELLSMNVSDYETKLLSEEERTERQRSGDTLWQRIVANEPGTVIGTSNGENRRKDGSTFPVEVLVGGVDYGGRRLILSSIRDVTERKALEERLKHQALHDPLTGLVGRELATDKLKSALARSRRNKESVAVLFVDVDNLKMVNDSLGHEAGDRLLVNAGEQLQQCVREGDTVARFGGDEFVVLLESSGSEEDALLVADRILKRFEEPLRVSGYEVPVTVSVGVAVDSYWAESSHVEETAPESSSVEASTDRGESGSVSAGELVRQADAAMYRAKSSGGASYAVFEPQMGREDIEHLELSSDLHRAIERGELRTYYQHKVDLSTGRVAGWEALLRWEHPERGPIAPDVFIPLAEGNGLIVPIGKWVLERACEQARIWRERYPKEPGQFMSVNLSAKQFADPALGDEVEHILERTGLPAAALDLEITERVLMKVEGSEFARMRELRELGLSFSLDDFGTGYSSLRSLKELPVDFIKIDRSFMEGVPGESEDESFVTAMVDLAHALGLAVVGEGVESEAQWHRLRELGCDYGQGYHFSPPLPSEAATLSMERLEREGPSA